MEGDAEVSVWMFHQKRKRRRKMLLFAGLVLGALTVTWIFSELMSTDAAITREHDKWLKDKGCKVISHRDGEWEHHWIGNYNEYIPSETCYRCADGKEFCE